MKRHSRYLLGALLFALPGLLPAQNAPELPKGESVRGITISTHGMGREWADPRVMLPTFEKIKSTGAEWVAFHPYASIRKDGSVSWSHRRRRRRGAVPTEQQPAGEPKVPVYWAEPVRLAHKAGLKVLIKPHLAYWGSGFSWRGEITFTDKTQWDRFFEQYSHWILTMAEACKDADGFIVGTELDKTIDHEKRWRALIAGVRQRTKAPLSYAANWTDFRRVRFWDALDVIGIQAYFPLSDKTDPSKEALEAAWAKRMATLRTYAKEHNRNVLFTELGYNQSFDAARTPWDHRTDGPEATALQKRCLSTALAAVEGEKSVLGSFLWKWFPEPRPNGRNFKLATKDIRALISEHWKQPIQTPKKR
jgi:Glycoside Hydrolase Family 113